MNSNLIHSYQMNGYSIVLDVHSGAVHVVDELGYDLLQELVPPLDATCPDALLQTLQQAGYPEVEIQAAYQQMYQLFQAGMLFSKDSYRPYADQLGPAPVKSMCLNVAHDCNLRCAYCFAAQGDFGGGRNCMPLAVGKAAIDFLIANSANRRNLEVDFFGGEPLMNLEVVRQVVTYARSLEQRHNKNFRFTITTNGLLLDDAAIDFINKEMSNVVLSLDGRREVNDRLRYRSNGAGSYDSIVPKYQKLVQARGEKEYYLRGTFTKHNLDFTQDVLHMADLGFKNLSMEPVITEETEPYALSEADLPRIFAEYETLAKEIIQRRQGGDSFHFFHFSLDLQQGPCAIKRLRGCSCGNEYVAVTPEGDIYPCHQFVGEEAWKMGNVLQGRFAHEMKKMFSQAHIYNKPECMQCWARFYCSGGCNATNAQHCGDIHRPYAISCALERKRVECAIMIQAALAESAEGGHYAGK